MNTTLIIRYLLTKDKQTTLKPCFVSEPQNQRHYCKGFHLRDVWRRWVHSIPHAYLYLKVLVNLSSTSRTNLATSQAFRILECLTVWYDHSFSAFPSFSNFSKHISTKGRNIRVFCPSTLPHDMALMWRCCQYWSYKISLLAFIWLDGFGTMMTLWHPIDFASRMSLLSYLWLFIPTTTTLFRAFIMSYPSFLPTGLRNLVSVNQVIWNFTAGLIYT